MSYLIIAYCVVAALVVRPLAGHFAWAWKMNHVKKPGGDDWGFAVVAAIFLAFFGWPFVLIFFLMGRVLPSVGAEREGRIAAQKEYIKQLERELELDERPQDPWYSR